MTNEDVIVGIVLLLLAVGWILIFIFSHFDPPGGGRLD